MCRDYFRQIGAGGMGVVYQAQDERLGRHVALKVLPAGTLADEAARKRFCKEALTLSQLNHPNIATVHDFDTQDGIDFLVMEHVAGTSLAQRLASGPLPQSEVAALGRRTVQPEAGRRPRAPGRNREANHGEVKAQVEWRGTEATHALH